MHNATRPCGLVLSPQQGCCTFDTYCSNSANCLASCALAASDLDNRSISVAVWAPVSSSRVRSTTCNGRAHSWALESVEVNMLSTCKTFFLWHQISEVRWCLAMFQMTTEILCTCFCMEIWYDLELRFDCRWKRSRMCWDDNCLFHCYHILGRCNPQWLSRAHMKGLRSNSVWCIVYIFLRTLPKLLCGDDIIGFWTQLRLVYHPSGNIKLII